MHVPGAHCCAVGNACQDLHSRDSRLGCSGFVDTKRGLRPSERDPLSDNLRCHGVSKTPIERVNAASVRLMPGMPSVILDLMKPAATAGRIGDAQSVGHKGEL